MFSNQKKRRETKHVQISSKTLNIKTS